MSDDPSPKPPRTGRAIRIGELSIRVPEELAAGTFANFALINHTPDEFIVDFSFIEPGGRSGIVRSRVILTPQHFKRLVAALQANLTRYEQAFGTIVERGKPLVPPKESGGVN